MKEDGIDGSRYPSEGGSFGGIIISPSSKNILPSFKIGGYLLTVVEKGVYRNDIIRVFK